MEREEKAKKNREAVKKCMKNRDRINIILPKGTLERIKKQNKKASEMARELILKELNKLEKENKK